MAKADSAPANRIDIIDGFRCLAVLLVVFFHYYWRYGLLGYYAYREISFFRIGSYGVQLFFMISGFVIYRSLERTDRASVFLGHRYIRLLPSLVLASILTYVAVASLDPNFEMPELHNSNPANFLFSFTFIHPQIFEFLFHKNNITFIDGAYWSLWAEVVFYIGASLVYFAGPRENFLRTWILLVLILEAGRILTSPHLDRWTPLWAHQMAYAYYRTFLFLDIGQWIYFTGGIIFYNLYVKRKLSRLQLFQVLVLGSLELFFLHDNILRLLFLLLIGLFILLVYRPSWLSFFRWRPFVWIGLASYPLYLIHENLGLVLIYRTTKWIGSVMPPVLVPLVILVFLILVSYGIFYLFEQPITRYARRKLFPR